MADASVIATRIQKLKMELGAATLIAVSKYTDNESVLAAYSAGQRAFGESRVQDLVTRAQEIAASGVRDISWHFIGHLQKNKVSKLLGVDGLDYIHSVDSHLLLQELIKRQDLIKQKSINLLFQVKTSLEQEKFGVTDLSELYEMVETIKTVSTKFKLVGLMTLGQIRTNNFEDDARKSFLELKDLARSLENRFALEQLELSMGMSQDYKIALECGANYVRIGGALFDEESVIL